MKKRLCYVSNSSSSSFIVAEDLTDKGVSCLKLTPDQKRLLKEDGYLADKDIEKDWYLTQFIYDRGYDAVEAVEHTDYIEGQMCCEPRDDEDHYNEYPADGFGDSVWLRKEHDTARQMTFDEFAKEYSVSGLPQSVIVRYESDGVKLLYAPGL